MLAFLAPPKTGHLGHGAPRSVTGHYERGMKVTVAIGTVEDQSGHAAFRLPAGNHRTANLVHLAGFKGRAQRLLEVAIRHHISKRRVISLPAEIACRARRLPARLAGCLRRQPPA